MSKQEIVHIPVEKILEVNRTYLIRKWWWNYVETLKGNIEMTVLNEITKELEKRGIVKEGLWMPREGAEDLAKEAEKLRRFK